MKNPNLRNVQFRCSKRFLQEMGPGQTEAEKTSRQEKICVALWSFLRRPHIYSKLEKLELREPVTEIVSVLVPDRLYIEISEYADSQGISLSEVIRMALYQEVVAVE